MKFTFGRADWKNKEPLFDESQIKEFEYVSEKGKTHKLQYVELSLEELWRFIEKNGRCIIVPPRKLKISEMLLGDITVYDYYVE